MKGERTAEAKHKPWRIRPLEGKYYGTIVEDAEGVELYSFWEHGLDGSHTPSARQLEYYDNPKPRSEDWSDLFCDSHHEGAQDYERAAVLVRAVNGYEAQRELIGELGEALRGHADNLDAWAVADYELYKHADGEVCKVHNAYVTLRPKDIEAEAAKIRTLLSKLEENHEK